MMETDIQQDPAITVLRCLPKGHFTLPQTHLLNMFIVALLTMASNWEQPMCSSTDEYIKKNVIHVHNEIFLCYQWALFFLFVLPYSDMFLSLYYIVIH